MTCLGVVQIDRLPTQNPLATRRLAGKPLTEWVVRRVSESQQLELVIVALGDSAASHHAARDVPSDVPVFFGNETDVLRRFADAAWQYGAEQIVRIRVDNPFIDPVLIDGLVTTAARCNCDYATYCQEDGCPAIFSPLGILAEWFTADSLHRADREATAPSDRQRVTRYFYTNPDRFALRLVRLPQQLDRKDIRLTVNTAEDWERTEQIYEALGPDQLDWQRIAGFLQQQPGLRERMAALNQNRSA